MDINSKCLTKIINYCTKSEYICHQRIPSSGKLKCTIEVPANLSENEVIDLALKNEKISSLVLGIEIRKKIYVKQKILNLVI